MSEQTANDLTEKDLALIYDLRKFLSDGDSHLICTLIDQLNQAKEDAAAEFEVRNIVASQLQQAQAREAELVGENGFNYVDITSEGCEGWLNLFFGGQVLCLVNNGYIANLIRQALND